MNNDTRELTLEQKYKEAIDGLALIMERTLRSEEIDWRTIYGDARDTLRQLEPELASRIEDAPYHPDFVLQAEIDARRRAESDRKHAAHVEQQRKTEERALKKEAEHERRLAENKAQWDGKSVRFINYDDYVAWHRATFKGHRKAYIESKQLPNEVMTASLVTDSGVRCSVRGRACVVPFRLIEVVE